MKGGIIPLCPICGRELGEPPEEGGWECKCGEFVPDGLQVSPRVQPGGLNARGEVAPAVSDSALLKGKLRGREMKR